MQAKFVIHLLICSLFVVFCLNSNASTFEHAHCYFAFPPQLEDGVYPYHYRPERTVDYTNLRLEIKTLFDTQTVEGTAYYTFQPIHHEVTTITLDAVDMTVHDVSYSGEIGYHWTHFDDQIHITFDDALPMDDTATLSINYSAEPTANLWFTDPNHVAPQKPDQIYTLNEPFGGSRWFPAPDYPNDRMVTEMVVTYPKDLVSLSNGLIIDSTEEGDWRTDHWKQEKPHVIYLISLVVGDFEIVEQEWRGIPVEYYVTEDQVDHVIPSMGMTIEMLDFFSDYLDYPYPYEKYAQSMVRDFRAGGMEHTTATTMYEYCVIDERGLIDNESEWLIMHELAHQWFGNLLTCESWPQLWLNEGFASYSEMLWAEHARGYDEYLHLVHNDMNASLNSGYQRPIVSNTFEDPMDMFDNHSYQKGASVLHMLRQRLGDELFQNSIQHYLNQNEDGLVDTDDLQESIEAVTGKPMDQFFEQWVYRAGYPNIKATHEWLPNSKQLKVTIAQTQDKKEGDPYFAFPLEIDIITQDETITKTIQISQKEESAFFELDQAPQSLAINPRLGVLMKLEHEKSQDMLLQDLAKGSTIIVRMRAADALKQHKTRKVVQALETAMNQNAYYTVQMHAAEALGAINTDLALDALLNATEHENPHTRRAIASALSSFYKNQQAYDALVSMYQNDESLRVVSNAANGIGRSGNDDAFDVLLAGLEQKSYRHIIQTSSINALAALETTKAWEPIEKFTHDPHGRSIRTTAIRALGRLTHAIEEQQEETLELLLEFLGSKSDFIREAAISGLQSLGEREAVSHLRQVANHDIDAGVRRQAQRAIDAILRDRGSEQVSENFERIEDLQEKQAELEKKIEAMQEEIKSLNENTKADDTNDEEK